MFVVMRRTKEAFRWIIEILRKHKIPFQISGGFAAKIYGSNRQLVDIDIGVPDNRLKEILPDVREYIIYGPKRYIDNYFDLLLMTLKYKGQEIDIYGNNKMKLFDCKNKKWVKNKINLTDSITKKVYGTNVPIIHKKMLIAYKKLIGINEDIKALKSK